MGIVAGSLRNGGFTSKPIMDLAYECQIYRNASSYTGLGSLKVAYVVLPGITPCDVIPITDDIHVLEVGGQDIHTHNIHLPAGTNILIRDAIKIVGSRTGFGPVGLSFYVDDVLLPSESISFIRLRVTQGKEPVAGAV